MAPRLRGASTYQHETGCSSTGTALYRYSTALCSTGCGQRAGTNGNGAVLYCTGYWYYVRTTTTTTVPGTGTNYVLLLIIIRYAGRTPSKGIEQVGYFLTAYSYNTVRYFHWPLGCCAVLIFSNCK